MTRCAPLFLSLSIILTLLASAPGAAPGDLTLFDAPRGTWLGTLRSDVQVVVLEEQDDWRRIRVEAWIPASEADPTGSPASAAGDPTAPGGPGAPTRASMGAIIRGVLTGPVGAPAGSALVVLLVSDLEAVDREHALAGAECSERLAEIDARIAALEEEHRRALNSSDNFREATSRSDRAKDDLRRAELARREAVRGCRETADAIFQRHTVKRTISDGAGRYEFLEVRPGHYRVIATRATDPPSAWSLECAVEGEGAIVLDPAAHSSRVRPYWDLD